MLMRDPLACRTVNALHNRTDAVRRLPARVARAVAHARPCAAVWSSLPRLLQISNEDIHYLSGRVLASMYALNLLHLVVTLRVAAVT